MSGTNPTTTWNLTNNGENKILQESSDDVVLLEGSTDSVTLEDPAQTPTQYMTYIDGNMSVMKRLVTNFAPQQSSPVAMTVDLTAGAIWNGSTLTEVTLQTTSSITAPTSFPRIDRIVTNGSGTVAVITGTENPIPVAPSFTGAVVPIAQVLLQPSTIAITNSMLTDERNFTYFGTNPGVVDRQVYQTPGTFTWTKPSGLGAGATVFIQVWSGGGSGGTHSASPKSGGGGGGGSYRFMNFLASLISGTVTVTVGAGGVGVTGDSLGHLGGNSSFGSYVLTFGGGPGAGGIFGGHGGAGGGWFLQGGLVTNDVPTGEGKGGDSVSTVSLPGTPGYWIGGGGGSGQLTTPEIGYNSVWGGGGGGSSNVTATAGGSSFMGGQGGSGGTLAVNGTNGTQPSGGGGGGGPTSGSGGAGQVFVTVFNG